MNSNRHRAGRIFSGVSSLGVLALGIVSMTSTSNGQGGPPPPPPVGSAGGPLPGLTADQQLLFAQGRGEFLQPENQATGLGPVFNGISCIQCHAAGGEGGASTTLGVSVVTRIGGMINGTYSDLEQFGGPVLQARSLREVNPSYPIGREFVPPQAQFVSRRQTTPLFGLGLIEAIPASTILSRSGVNQGGSVMGIANMVLNPETGQMEVGRFGWKAQISSIHVFSGDAYLNEMGITNPTFPTELPPQGLPIPPGADPIPDPEDEAGLEVERLTNYQRLLGPPPSLPPTKNSEVGRELFHRIKCNACHVPSMNTGPNPIAALSNKQVNLYSDLLIHRMGSTLADGIRQGLAQGDMFRTAPLWGIRLRGFYMHDGRARTIDQAIRLHGGEANVSRLAYITLSREEQTRIADFLMRL